MIESPEVDAVEQLFERARAEFRRGDLDEAVAIFDDAVRRAPDLAAAHLRRGIALRFARRYAEACDAFRTAIALDPELATAHHGLGSALLVMGRAEDAFEHLDRACELDPDNADIRNETGCALLSLARRDEAAGEFERAAALRPDWPVPLKNLAVIALRNGRRDAALELTERARAIGASLPIVHADRGMHLLAEGEFSEGWRGYEWRWPDGKPPHRSDLVVPVWDGSPLGERTLLLWSEQGYGDVLQFVRFASLIPKERGRVLLHAPQPLARVLATCPGIDRVVVDGDRVDLDVQFPLLSLPAILGAAPQPVPPYLSAPAECADAENAIERGTALNVGIVWASGKLYLAHAARDCPLELFAPLADIPGVRLYSLQFGEAAAELAECPAPIVDLAPVLGDFYKTAAFVKRLDLIVSVDTSLAHLAGALGAPTWTLIPHSPDWRWMRGGTDSLWYASMKLYRQQTPGDWRPVMERIARDLRELTAGRHSCDPLPKRAVTPKRRVVRDRVYIKQYGERATGTNVVRASLLASRDDVELLLHVLGDKHSYPAPLDALRREAESTPDPAWSFAAWATFGTPAFMTQLWNADQIHEVRRLANGVKTAFDRGELRYLITIRNPYAWAVSIARHDRFILGREMPLPPAFAAPLARACRRFNRLYASWLALADAHPQSARVVRYEDLLRESGEVDFGIAGMTYGWKRVTACVQPAIWDHWRVSLSGTAFDAAPELRGDCLLLIPAEHRKIIAETIDWSLIRLFGYEPLAI